MLIKDVKKLLDLFQNNLMIFVYLLAFIFIFRLIILVFKKLELRLNYCGWYETVKNKFGSKMTLVIFLSIVLAFLTTLQENYKVISLGTEQNHISIVISILTLYGILYAFIQFTISYSLQNINDKYLGRSVTRHVLFSEPEFKVFNSYFFMVFLIYAAVFPFLKLIFGMRLFNNYYSFAFALWEISVFGIFVLYVFIFLKSLIVMKKFFDIHEGQSSMWIQYSIEKKIKLYYKELFTDSMKYKDFYVMNVLFDEIKKLDGNEQKKLLSIVIDATFDELNHDLMKISSKRLKKKKRNFYNDRSSFVYNLFLKLFMNIKQNKVDLEFNELLFIFKLQEETINKLLNTALSGNESEIIDSTLYLYRDNSPRNFFETNFYFKPPDIIWDSVSSYRDLDEIHNSIINREIVKQILSEKKLTNSEAKLLESYERYFNTILDKYRSYTESIKTNDHSLFLSKFNLNNIDKNNIYNYIINLSYNNENKEFVSFLLKKLDYKYKVSFTMYQLVYTGSYNKWKKDILFLKSIFQDSTVDEKVLEKDVIEFVCKKIKENTGRRIDQELIKWVMLISNHRSVNIDTLRKVNEFNHFSIPEFFKLKYILSEHEGLYLDLNNLNYNHLKDKKGDNWLLIFLRELLESPEILKNEFFIRIIYKFFQKIKNPYEIEDYIWINDFRMFYVNPFLKISEDKFREISNESYLGKGLINYLILNLDRKDYSYLYENDFFKSIFSNRVKTVLSGADIPVETYLDNLVGMTKNTWEPISVLQKDEILSRLKMVVDK